MCSDHAMVRRAATEIFCNMAGHDSVLKVRTYVHFIVLHITFDLDDLRT